MSIRLPNSLHKAVKVIAKEEQISINQLITSALAEKISALDTETYLKARGNRASIDNYERILKKVPPAPTPDYDALE
jgi:predicted DNA-binding ribbon-helix-helix protein